jgi:isopentenyl-diphosphate Delta-isomerase
LEKVVLVDEFDQEIGEMEKLEAHQKGLLHRAFSILIFNSKNELLLQKRAAIKYHSANLWTNTCCSHPLPKEELLDAAKRRLDFEMGMNCPLKTLFSFVYKIEFDNGLVEHELDHVLIGRSDENPNLNPDEASEYKWITLRQLKNDINQKPMDYTYWFKLIMDEQIDKIEKSLEDN